MHTTMNTRTPHLSNQPEPIWYGNSLLEFFVPAEASGGTISVFRSTFAAGFSPPRHVHTREDEVFMVEKRTLPPAGAVPFDVARVMAAQEERGTPRRRPAARTRGRLTSGPADPCP